MLLQFDLIIWLLKSPQTPQSLAGGLHAGGEVVREVLDSLQSEGLLNEAAALSGTSWSSIPRLSPEAKETYQPILDRTEGLRPDQVVLNTL
ncbi:MAG: hypothetical protein M3Y75_02075, partial [Actinomycetota bacterium]|nr:hypothetical protein [Actinomycetota bacterium]